MYIQEDVSSAICKRIWVGHMGHGKENAVRPTSKTRIFFLTYVAHSVLLATTHSLILQRASKQLWHTLKAKPLKMPRICFLNTSHTVSTSISRCTLPHALSVYNVKPSSFDTLSRRILWKSPRLDFWNTSTQCLQLFVAAKRSLSLHYEHLQSKSPDNGWGGLILAIAKWS